MSSQGFPDASPCIASDNFPQCCGKNKQNYILAMPPHVSTFTLQVEKSPSVVRENVPKEIAEDIKARLEAAGAKCEIE